MVPSYSWGFGSRDRSICSFPPVLWLLQQPKDTHVLNLDFWQHFKILALVFRLSCVLLLVVWLKLHCLRPFQFVLRPLLCNTAEMHLPWEDSPVTLSVSSLEHELPFGSNSVSLIHAFAMLSNLSNEGWLTASEKDQPSNDRSVFIISLHRPSHFFILTCHSTAGLMEQRWKIRLSNLTGSIGTVSSSNLLLYLSCCIFYFFLCANSPAQPLGSADKLRISPQRRQWRTVLLPQAFSCPTTWHPWNSVRKSDRKWWKQTSQMLNSVMQQLWNTLPPHLPSPSIIGTLRFHLKMSKPSCPFFPS